ncbi:hypothetical protein BDP27DRAFT_1419121 [Rhodocollybia butyracea]|uniref:Uncharacterized protein n=1 Tax=Rhodocollybia butyracea TaxID=206335 RepID=A0A9P5U9T3_9AGAR|nr:hypothetical protein BDP27DRAFT_1419121 [Rhodocollybia butyracea]
MVLGVFVEYATLDAQQERRAAIVSKSFGIIPSPLPSPFADNFAYFPGGDVPFLPIPVCLLLPNTS